MDDLAGKWAGLSLNTQESQTVPLTPTTEDHTRVLIAKLFTKRRVNIEALSRTLRSMWRSIQQFEIRDLGSNTVLLLFSDAANALKILAQQPWSFDKYHIGLYKPTEHESVEAATFDYATFWIQLHNIPITRMNKANAEAIGRTMGRVEQVDTSPNGECRGKYIRVRVTLDIRQPLSRGRFVDMGSSEPLWISVQYERMPIFCYWCGLLNHDEKDCKAWLDSNGTLNKDDQQYGPWLRANTTNIQQPQVVNSRTSHTPPPPPNHRPTPSPQTKPLPPSPITAVPSQQTPSSIPPENHATPSSIPPVTHATSQKPLPTPSSIPPVTHATPQKPLPTNKEILSDPDLFHAHITDIDLALNSSPNQNPMTPTTQLAHDPKPETHALSNNPKSTIPHKESSNFEETSHQYDQRTIIAPKSHDSQHDAHTSTHLNTIPTLGPKLATWRRIGPPTPHAMESSNEPILGPKRKSQALDTQNTIFTQKKHRTLEDEAKVLGKLMADNLGSAVAARQHRREQ